MKFFDELNSCQYLDILEIGETEDSFLRFVVVNMVAKKIYGLPGEDDEQDKGVRDLISSSRPVETTSTSVAYEIVFEDYISYSVINESFIIENDTDSYEGNLVRIYQKSEFLEYIKKMTFATIEYPGPFQHYGFRCGDHIIDIVSTEEPLVKKTNIK